MPYQPVTNGRKVEMNASQNGVPIVNVYNITDIEPATLARLEEIAEVFHTWWDDFLRGSQHNTYVLENITVTDISVENGIQFVYTGFTPNAGAAGGDAAAANAAAVISWRTGNTGRSFRGRTFVGGLPVAAFLNAQTLTSTAVSAYAVAGTALIDALTAIDAVLVVVSRFAGGLQRVTALASQIISVIVDAKGDSQRRRTAN